MALVRQILSSLYDLYLSATHGRRCHAIEFANVVASRAFAVGQFWLAKSDPAPHIELDDTS
ncbi:uncharacterized protein PHALS_03607 [Plasmopara halstedii]|uniref:Uncharacterized protein n=1 Tax=Plasmopara halstedii TaxID=4781 RepID=A0A0P1AWY0_PLAHL|nr:uncharacterized protein PHALS_03607 [Plasmopara halstedii]CEG46938.1 hypothetical protein PHALS_03607 [Plasmopara halstedii]|eukprot:XP_024583307.1 hypothetical protein PHALS_03607 [Plasmopara halstedii]